MSSAIPKFQQPSEANDPALEAAILVAAVEESPEPMALTENGKLIFANRSFAQLSADSLDASSASLIISGYNWQATEFGTAGRIFTLTTIRREPPILTLSDSQHLAIVGRLVGGVAHDFNNLLTGILLYCDLLQTKGTLENPLSRRVDEIRTAAEQGAALIRQLMTLGRDESCAPRVVYFNRAVRELVPLLSHLLGENIRILTDLAEGPGLVGISLAQAQQIILNLALNARDAMPTGGSVRLETRFLQFEGTGPGERIFEFTACDTGEGMDAQIAFRIFDPFFTTKPPERGTGMGLATVRKIVEDAGGIVCVETSPGKGTRMTVRLPEIDRDAQKTQPLSLPPVSEKRGAENRGAIS
jgi:signal transduction histidine kinase